MANDSSFEDMLKREFRWPKMADRPFSESPDWQRNASIARRRQDRLVLMMTGYKAAADLMVERAAGSGYGRDTLVFPIVFNYRHFIELSLKYLIATYGRSVNVEPNWKSHDLAELWRTFKGVLKQYGDNDPDQTNQAVENIIAEFAKVDPQSFAYRYPVDRDGNLLELGQSELDLQSLAAVMKGLERYFTGCDGWLDDLQGNEPTEY
jgi:hypothetical protein